MNPDTKAQIKSASLTTGIVFVKMKLVLIFLYCMPALAVNLIWDDSPAHDASTRYNLYQSADANQWRLAALTKTNFVTAHLRPGSNYFIVTISRLNGDEESEPSNMLGLRGYHFERVQAQAIVIGP